MVVFFINYWHKNENLAKELFKSERQTLSDKTTMREQLIFYSSDYANSQQGRTCMTHEFGHKSNQNLTFKSSCCLNIKLVISRKKCVSKEWYSVIPTFQTSKGNRNWFESQKSRIPLYPTVMTSINLQGSHWKAWLTGLTCSCRCRFNPVSISSICRASPIKNNRQNFEEIELLMKKILPEILYNMEILINTVIPTRRPKYNLNRKCKNMAKSS